MHVSINPHMSHIYMHIHIRTYKNIYTWDECTMSVCIKNILSSPYVHREQESFKSACCMVNTYHRAHMSDVVICLKRQDR